MLLARIQGFFIFIQHFLLGMESRSWGKGWSIQKENLNEVFQAKIAYINDLNPL